MTDYWVCVIAAPSRRRRTYVVHNCLNTDEARELALSDPIYARWGDETVTVTHLSEVELSGNELVVDATDFRPTTEESR